VYDSQTVTETVEWPIIAETDPGTEFGRRGGLSHAKPLSMRDDRRVGACRLWLYVAGETVISRKARENLQRLRESHATAVETVVIDVLSEPALAEKARILATPTLVFDHPTRSKRVIGDLSDIEKVIEFLGLQQRDEGL
jgi:circadian clock protein KaiB